MPCCCINSRAMLCAPSRNRLKASPCSPSARPRSLPRNASAAPSMERPASPKDGGDCRPCLAQSPHQLLEHARERILLAGKLRPFLPWRPCAPSCCSPSPISPSSGIALYRPSIAAGGASSRKARPASAIRAFRLAHSSGRACRAADCAGFRRAAKAIPVRLPWRPIAPASRSYRASWRDLPAGSSGLAAPGAVSPPSCMRRCDSCTIDFRYSFIASRNFA